jgi:hypothetical protein
MFSPQWENFARECLVVGGRLVNASAFVVGPENAAAASLANMARGLGFSSVATYAGLKPAEKQAAKTPLIFFLCAAVTNVKSLKPMADAIRFSPNLKLRFSPLIYFAQNPSVDSIKACIQMGFDDVIALPHRDLGERIFRQVGRPQAYYETTTYFGPDRRNGSAPRPGDGGDEFRRIEILRSPENGVDVLHDDFQFVI